MKQKISKIMSLALSILLISLTFTGCDISDKKEKNYKVGICQFTEHKALEVAQNGFKDALTEMLGDRVSFIEKNAYGIKYSVEPIISGFSKDKVDLIMTNATTALSEAYAIEKKIPIVATSVTDYATALDIENWNGTTGLNVTGTSDLAPLELQAEMVKKLVPDAENVGILYCKNEPNSIYQADHISPFFEAFGLKVKEYTFSTIAEVTAASKKAVAECDVIYIPTDNTAAANAKYINDITEPAKIPVITGGADACAECGIATLSINYYDIGYRSGEMAYDILENGYDPAEMKIEFADNAIKYAVRSRAKKIGIEIPEDYIDLE